VTLIWSKKAKDKVTAMKLEYKIKRMGRGEKEAIIRNLKKL